MEPLTRSFTREQLMELAQEWLKTNYGAYKSTEPDAYYAKLGLLVDFVTDLIPEEGHQP